MIFINPSYSQTENDSLKIDQTRNFADTNLRRSGRFVENLSDALQASITIYLLDGHGSGFYISDHFVVTNYHVIEGQSLFTSRIGDKVVQFDLYAADEALDLAILKSDHISKVYFSLSQHPIEVGQQIFIVGSPTSKLLANSISSGIISGFRELDELDIIQTDAKINSGNSGGALIDTQGHLYGVVTSKLAGFGIEGVGFAISTKYIFQLLNQKMTQ